MKNWRESVFLITSSRAMKTRPWRRNQTCLLNVLKARKFLGFFTYNFWSTFYIKEKFPERAPQVDGQLFGVRLPIFNFKF